MGRSLDCTIAYGITVHPYHKREERFPWESCLIEDEEEELGIHDWLNSQEGILRDNCIMEMICMNTAYGDDDDPYVIAVLESSQCCSILDGVNIQECAEKENKYEAAMLDFCKLFGLEEYNPGWVIFPTYC